MGHIYKQSAPEQNPLWLLKIYCQYLLKSCNVTFPTGRMVQSSECSALALAVPCSASLIPLPESLVLFPLPYQCCVNLPSLVYQDVHLLPVYSATGAEVTDRQKEVRLLPP